MMLAREKEVTSWGRLDATRCTVHTPCWPDELSIPATPVLGHGLGRSYGDSCLLDGGHLIETARLDRLIEFNPDTGLLRAEAGISLDAILRFSVPKGWFLPTSPGTRQVTLGGAIANDIHGKNHHRVGCFGNFVPKFEILRSDGTRQKCVEGDPLHAATIGGLGLTGLITWAELRLTRIQSAFLDVELIRFGNIDEFLSISNESANHWEHTVAWLDCMAHGRNLGRGIFIRGNWSAHGSLEPHSSRGPAVPFDFPEAILNRFTLTAFNTAYYRRFIGKTHNLQQHYSPFFHPLDSMSNWNRLYGKRGFFQYQCVTPTDCGTGPMKALLQRISRSGQGSFLAVLKTFGDIPSPGLLSFPRPGLTLALDFPNRGDESLRLFEELDAIVRECGGRLYPAKDARMKPTDFHASYPGLDEFEKHLDPGFLSDFWKRMHPDDTKHTS